MNKLLEYPFDSGLIRRKQKSIKRELLSAEGLLEKKVAVLGGSTTHDIITMMELFLLRNGIKPSFYESEYGQFWQDAMFENEMPCDGSILTNARQFDACRRAYEAMLRSLKGLQLGLTPDAVLTDVEEAMEAMGEVTGATVRVDITARIFQRFCVGK